MSEHPLLALITENISRQGGVIAFSAFMDLALYAPHSGYYTGTRPKIGRSGDFITAPEVSPLFAQCLAVACQPVLANVSHPEIVEIGAGLGTLAADLLLALEQLQSLPDCYHIIEISPTLQALQQKTLQDKAPHLLSRVQFHREPLSQIFNGIILGNEILDALPITRFTIRQGMVQEMGVGLQNQQLSWQPFPASRELQRAVAALQTTRGVFAEGYTSEIALNLKNWLYTHTHALQQGAVFWIDYGYPQKEFYAPYRSQGTLHCHYQHHLHDNPFMYLGEQDITAHVDFTAVATAALELDFTATGYTTQALFLASCGISDFLQRAIEHNPQNTLALQHQVKRLTHPHLMGDMFKVIALQKNQDLDLMGFQFANLLHLL